MTYPISSVPKEWRQHRWVFLPRTSISSFCSLQSQSYRKGLARPGDAEPILTPLIQVSISSGHLVALPRVLFQSKLSKVIYVVYVLYFIHINHETKSIGNRHSILIIICNLAPQRLSMYRTANKWFKKKLRSLNLVLYLLVSIKVCKSGNSLRQAPTFQPTGNRASWKERTPHTALTAVHKIHELKRQTAAETGVRDLSLAWKIKTVSTKNAFILILSVLETTHASLMYTSWKHPRHVFLVEDLSPLCSGIK